MHDKYLLIPLVTLAITQVVKLVIEVIITKKFNFERLMSGSGGMPSSHTALVTSLTTALFIGEGYDSPIFALALVMSLIVAYDSMGLRLQSGMQAAAINKLIEHNGLNSIGPLKEMIGHKPVEVAVGILDGIIMGTILMHFWG